MRINRRPCYSSAQAPSARKTICYALEQGVKQGTLELIDISGEHQVVHRFSTCAETKKQPIEARLVVHSDTFWVRAWTSYDVGCKYPSHRNPRANFVVVSEVYINGDISAARRGCTVDTLTLSIEQKSLAEERIANAGFSDQITVDYRPLDGLQEHAAELREEV